MNRALRCRTAGATIALDLAAVRGVERADRVRPVADAWPQVGELAAGVPVLSLAGMLGADDAGGNLGGQLVLIDAPDGRLALLADGVSQPFDAPPDSLDAVPRLLGEARFAGVLRLPGEVLPWLSLGGEPVRTNRPAARPAGGPADRLALLPLTVERRPWVAAVPAALVGEVSDLGRLDPVPGSPEFVRGLTAWRGRTIAVADLAAWLGFAPAADQPGARLVVVHPPGWGEPVGMITGRGVRVVGLPVPHVRSFRTPPGEPPGVAAVVEADAATLVLLDLGELCRGAAPAAATA